MKDSNMLSADELSKLDHTPLTFGKYKGKTPDEVSKVDCSWLIWAFENVTNRPVFMSELLYNECLKTPNLRPPKSVTIGTNHGGVSTQERYTRTYSNPKPAPRGSLAESRSHLDDPDNIPF